jgi:hypothetical protein
VIFVGAFEDLLFAEISVAGCGGDVSTFSPRWRNSRRKG